MMFHWTTVLSLGWLLMMSTAVAREGFVRTREGGIIEGHLRFESNSIVVVNAQREMCVHVALTNLSEVVFHLPESAIEDKSGESAGTDVPLPWQSDDVGHVRLAGHTRFVSGQFHVRGGGTNIWADRDSFHFVFQTVMDTTEIVARITRVQVTDPWARAGLMMRESLSASSRNVFLALTAARGAVLQWRERLGEGTSIRMDRGAFVPYWLKLKREGDIFSALKSSNGRHWWLVDKIRMKAARELYVGLAVVGVGGQTLNHSVFEHVEQGAALRNRWFVPRVEMESGSAQAGHIHWMDDTAVHFEPSLGRTPISTLNICNIRFRPVPGRLGSFLNAGSPGVLLSSGEFVDGEFRGIRDGRIIVGSVPLGLCRFDYNDNVIALVLRKRGVPKAFSYEVKTADGSVWRGIEVSLDEKGVLIREPSLGLKRIALHEVLELRRCS